MPSQCFVVIENEVILCQSLLKALDLAFKVFFVLDLNYPAQCNSIWEFFENVVYCIGKRNSSEKSTSQTVKILQSLFSFEKV